MPIPFVDLFTLGAKIIDRVIPDPAQKAAAQLELAKLAQSGELEQLHADSAAMHDQAEIDKVEAESPSLFKSGWRPAVGWICAFGLGYDFLVQPILSWVSAINRWALPPTLDVSTLITLLGGLLGLGTLRTFEKFKGVD